MARSRKRLVYLEPELDALIKERAGEMDISVNEWFVRLAEHYLAQKGVTITYTETKKVSL